MAAKTRDATCEDCSGAFKCAPQGKVPKRCPDCKGNGSSAARKKAPSASAGLWTVRMGQLSIDCHSIESLNTLIEEWGGEVS
jgi:DnaJ-class molecular chaperone